MIAVISFTLMIFYPKTLFFLSYSHYIHIDVSIHCLRTISGRQFQNKLIINLIKFSSST